MANRLNMSNLSCRRTFHSQLKTRFIRRILILRRCLRSFFGKASVCWTGDSVTYKQLQNELSSFSPPPPDSNFSPKSIPMPQHCPDLDPSDVVPLKICLLGDGQIGKTSFLTKYVGRKNEDENLPMTKTLSVGRACISYSIWEVGADVDSSHNQISEACSDSVAILFMFDLTSRRSLNSVISWYKQARKWNQTAIPVLVGTKFDDFVQLPIDLQWTIASEARAYAKALNATLFFSSATYNINVNKIFKFITAKLFNLQWTMDRNLTIGEPLIDY